MHVFLLAILISVTGQGHVSAAPDMATESFTIATNSASAVQAASDNNARYQELVSKLRALGIPQSAIKTGSYSMYYTAPQQPEPASSGAPVTRNPSGYFVNRDVQVTLHDLASVGRVIDAAVAAGVTGTGGVAFGVSDTRGLFARAVASAVTDARTQALAMAQAAGLRIVRIHSMQQGGYVPMTFPGPVPMARIADAAAPPTQIEPHAVDANASVTVVYEAQ